MNKGSEHPLLEHFQRMQREIGEVDLTFDDIESIRMAPLPGAAYRDLSWWHEEDEGAPDYAARGWLRAGWHVRSVSMEDEVVSFERDWYRDRDRRDEESW